ncbi:hypothetical protein [Candidatus Electronema sp. PJ]|uniref:hypothetical protein n=1 Tax=Candidatus Electronema sp. PJ TaxID=3401572 RepID=UPI003AA99897
MKLTIKRDQSAKKGLFGGHKGMTFSLYCKVQISQEEQELIDKYKVNDYVLTWRQGNDEKIPGITASSLVQGHATEVWDVATLLNNEEVIKEACRDFKDLLLVMATFGGEEIVEI